MIRDTLIPPPVLPAQAPINISITSSVLEICGQTLKSVVPYPVVVIMEPTWKNAWRRASRGFGNIWRILKAMIKPLARMMPR